MKFPRSLFRGNGCLWHIGDYTTQLFKDDYNKPLEGSLLNNQYNRKRFFSWLTGGFQGSFSR